MMNPEPVPRESFLNAISQLESSGGKNIDHPVIESGPQAGQKAVGRFGLLPNTISELNNRARLANELTPEMQIAGRNPASLQTNPNLEQVYVNRLAEHILGNINDPEMAAYAWNSGHNLTPEKIKQRDYKNDPYVKKFSKIWKTLGDKK